MKLARLYVCTMTSVLFFSSNSIGKTEQNTFLWLLCSFCCSHACFCDDDRVSSFNIQLTTSVTSLDLIRCPSPFSLSLCFLFAIQYVRMISYGVLCFNRLRECPRGLQRPWLIFFFVSFVLFIPLLPLYVLKKNNRYITTKHRRAFIFYDGQLAVSARFYSHTHQVCFGKMKRHTRHQFLPFKFSHFFFSRSFLLQPE